MSELLNVFEPAADEEMLGYLRRLATENHYPDWRSLLRSINTRPSLSTLDKQAPEIAAALGIEATWIERLTTSTARTALDDPRFQRSTVDAICPLCLKESAHVRKGWRHCFTTACATHGVELIDHCPSCLSPLLNSRRDITHCDCGFDLRAASPRTAPAVYQWVSARLAGQTAPVDGMAELGEPEDYAQLHHLLFLLAVRAVPDQKVRATEVALPKTLNDARTFLEPAVAILSDWPRSFAAHIAERFEQGNQLKYNLSGRLGQWYLSLSALCNRPRAFAQVWQAFSDAVIDNFDGNLRGQNTLRPSPGKVRKYISIAEAARQIGTAHANLTAAARKGAIEAHITKQGVAYEIIMIKRAEVDRIRRAREKWITESDAGEMLGVSAAVINGLKRAGILCSDTKWKDDFFKGGPIHVDSVFELIDRVRGLMVARNASETVAFSRLTGRRTTDGLAMTRLYQAIFDGDIRAVGHDAEHGLGGFLFPTDEVRRYLGSIALDDGFTLTQIEKATGWKYEALSHWVEAGLLETTSVKLHGRTARVVSLASLMAFRRAWMPVADVARELETKPSALTQKLLAHGIEIHGQKSLPAGVKRGGLVRIRDIAAVLADRG